MPKSSVQHIVNNYKKASEKHDPKDKLSKGDKKMKIFIANQNYKNLKFYLPDIIKEFNLNASTSTFCRSNTKNCFINSTLPKQAYTGS